MNIVNIPSSKGRGKQTPNRVIIHSMSEYLTDGKISYHAKEFLDKIGLSAHYLITPSGVIIQTRQNNQIAWHAKGHNTNTIGIEILVAGVHTYQTFIDRIEKPYVYGLQYTALVEICREFKAFKFQRHSDISPGRKFDPGAGLDWDTLLSDISH